MAPPTFVASVPMPNQQQQQQQSMPMPGYPVFSPYAPPCYPQHEINHLQQQIPKEIYEMYMKLNPEGITPPGLPETPGTPIHMVQTHIEHQTSSPTGPRKNDSGNETISPLQQQQQTPSNSSPAVVSPRVLGILNQTANTPQGNQMMMLPGQSTNSMYAMNNILGASISANTSPTDPGVGEEKENMNKRRNTYPTSSTKKPRLSEQTPMVYSPPIDPNIVMMRMLMEPRREHCVICGDNATGYHYKAMSCEGCKGFFRRSVPREVHEKYVCMQKETCQFTLENCALNRNFRNRCKSCRFRRCLAMGMNMDCVRPIEYKTKKDARGYMENLSPTLEAFVSTFQSQMSTRERIASKTQALDCIRSLLQNSSEFDGIQVTEKLIEQLLPGLMTIRAAFTLDTLPFYTSDNATVAGLIEKIRMGIRNTILFDEGLAILSGIFIFQFTNGGSGQTFQSFFNGLRQHFDTTQSQESGTTERMLTKLGLLI